MQDLVQPFRQTLVTVAYVRIKPQRHFTTTLLFLLILSLNSFINLSNFHAFGAHWGGTKRVDNLSTLLVWVLLTV